MSSEMFPPKLKCNTILLKEGTNKGGEWAGSNRLLRGWP